MISCPGCPSPQDCKLMDACLDAKAMAMRRGVWRASEPVKCWHNIVTKQLENGIIDRRCVTCGYVDVPR